ncbi:hypothetical protein [Caenispirillum bisanense]|uniref:7-cyano-7-deazaguanine reductase n=1 Tax=Caenispirillum bisanense TaxID=414052 RepID=A0A286GWP5_9PROT|nr:hypothetical protein [Caenispirillum bisanense]SOD99967.1 7-cyano-7-deazaguanine reductase [Caenispirillum bisanense]
MSRDALPVADPAPRRALLRLADNPEPALDYMVTLTATLPDGGGLVVRCVPDRAVLDTTALPEYLAAVPPGRPEATATLILGDLANELLPRWLRVAVTAPAPGPGGIGHTVVMEERRPRWDNPALLAQLAPL